MSNNNANEDKVADKPLYQAVLQSICHMESNLLQTEDSLFREKIDFFDERIKAIQKGSSSEYLRELKKLSLARESAFQSANLEYKYKVSLVEMLHQHEMEAIEKDFQNEVQAIRSAMLLEIEDRLHKLREDKDNVDINSSYEVEKDARGHPSTRRNRKRGDIEGQKSKRKQNNMTCALPLKEEERLADIKEMKKLPTNKRD